MLGVTGYKFKKDLKKAIGQPLNYVETSMFGAEYKSDGVLTVVGSDAYKARNWYARVTMKDDVIVKVDQCVSGSLFGDYHQSTNKLIERW